ANIEYADRIRLLIGRRQFTFVHSRAGNRRSAQGHVDRPAVWACMNPARTLTERHRRNNFVSGRIDNAQITRPFICDVDTIIAGLCTPAASGENKRQCEEQTNTLKHGSLLELWPTFRRYPRTTFRSYFVRPAGRQDFFSSRHDVVIKLRDLFIVEK